MENAILSYESPIYDLITPPCILSSKLSDIGGVIAHESFAFSNFDFPCEDDQFQQKCCTYIPQCANMTTMVVLFDNIIFGFEGISLLPDFNYVFTFEDYANDILMELDSTGLASIRLSSHNWNANGPDINWRYSASVSISPSVPHHFPHWLYGPSLLNSFLQLNQISCDDYISPSRSTFYHEYNHLCTYPHLLASTPTILPYNKVASINRIFSLNYFHFVIQTLPALITFSNSNLNLSEWTLLTYNTSFSNQYLHLLGWNSFDNNSESNRGNVLFFESLNGLVSAKTGGVVIGTGLQPSKETIQAIRMGIPQIRNILEANIDRNLILIIKRSQLTERSLTPDSHDKIMTAVALYCQFMNCTFETVELEKLSVINQIQIFSKSQAVIGVSGAGLANIVFMPSNSIVIEIIPARFNFGNGLDASCESSLGYTYFSNIAGIMGNMYRHVSLSYCGWDDVIIQVSQEEVNEIVSLLN